MNKHKFNTLRSSYSRNGLEIGSLPKCTIATIRLTTPSTVDYLVSITIVYMLIVLGQDYGRT